MDPFASGTRIPLAASPASPLCPVNAVSTLLARCPTLPNAPAFNRLYGPFSKWYFIEKVHEYLLRCGIPTAGFSGHSIQKGAAVTAKVKGLSKEDIKLLGRWKSDAVDLYINDVPQSSLTANLLSLNSRLLLSASQGPSRLPPRLPPSSPLPQPTSSPSSPSARRLARRDWLGCPRVGGGSARMPN